MRSQVQDDRISERRITFHDKDDKEMVERHTRCLLTFASVLSLRLPFCPIGSPEFMKEYYDVRFACVPELATLKQVRDVNDEIAWQKVICDLAGITLFKIPRLVNDIEGYVVALLCEHYKQL